MNSPQENKDNGHDSAPGQNITIVVNGRQQPVHKVELTFSEIVALSGQPTGPDVTYTVTYRRGHGSKPEGSLVDGESVKVKDGMIINVSATTKS